jgi:hypothetical protein
MGLDIYLTTAAHASADKVHDEAWLAYYEREDYEQLTDEQHAEIKAGLPEYTSKSDDADEVRPSRHPKHLFNRRYLRSSYNSGGFNRVVPDFIGEDHGLYWIFAPMEREWDGDDGNLTAIDLPRLSECLKRAQQVVEELRTCDPIRVMSESLMLGNAEHMWHEPPTEDQALAWYRDEKLKHADVNQKTVEMFGEGYSNAKGFVAGFTKGMEVLAVTVGRDIIGRPAAMLIYRPPAENVTSYIESAEITVEFVEEAIMLIERDGAANLHWSG